MNDFSIVLAWIQGLYFLVTGVWPLVHVRSFMAVTGPKTDVWLVQTVGVLIIVIALTILLGAWQGKVEKLAVFIAVGSALALTMVDIVFVLKRQISKIYLVDAAVELALLGGWCIVMLDRRA